MTKSKNIVLIHGWGASTKKLTPLGRELSRLGWKVFIPKLPGFDLEEPESIWNNEDYSNYVYEKANRYFYNKKFFVFGHSFGGGLAIKMANREDNKIKGVILCATRGVSRGKLVKRILFYILAKLGKLLLLIPFFARNFKKLLYKLAREHDYEKTGGTMRGVFKKVISEDLKENIISLKSPVLILWGSEDKVTPIKDAKYIKSHVLISDLIIYKNQKHSLPYVSFRKIARDVDLWQNHLK